MIQAIPKALKKAVGFLMPDLPHYLDHLGVICDIMEIPLLCLDPSDAVLAGKFYPTLRTEVVDYNAITPEYLISQYDVLFNADVWDRDKFHKLYGSIEKQYKKHFRVIYCPHGFSDKGFYLAEAAKEDATLIYGQNMLDLIAHHESLHLLQDYVITGNYRLAYYKKHQRYYDQLIEKEVLSQFKKRQTTLLYAPTWGDYENSSSFFSAAETLFETLPDHYNMIAKLHPHLEYMEETITEYYRILGKFEGKPNLLFLRDFPTIYPLLAHSDIYVGDMSSIGYDYLSFNRPMFFLNPHRRDTVKDRGLYLFRCGIEVPPSDYNNFYKILQAALPEDAMHFKDVRQSVYNYTYGNKVSLSELRERIETLATSKNPDRAST